MSAQRPMQRSDQRPVQRLLIRTPGNRFDLDLSKIPPNMTYEWKRKTFLGREDIEHLVNLDANGWSPVPAERHKELSGTRLQSGAEIVRGGQVLMERPKELSEEARELDGFAARQQVAAQIQRLGLSAQRSGVGRGLKRAVGPVDADLVMDDA